MAKKKFSTAEWKKIMKLADSSSQDYGFPQRRDKSVVIGTFNIRKLGQVKGRSNGAWDFLTMICERFDLLAIQEVMDDMAGIRELLRRMVGTDFGMVVSDATGVFPGERGNAERLAFLFKWTRVRRTELASDITYDRTEVIRTLFENRVAFCGAFQQHAKDISEWNKKARKAKQAGKKKPGKPLIELPEFLTFIRQPHCASFEVIGHNGAAPYEFLVVNAHLLYGKNPRERRAEFDALIKWLTLRAKQSTRLYHKNLLMMGDCNLEFEEANIKRADIDAEMKRLNATKLKSKKAAKVNFPLLDPHPRHGLLRTTARQGQTYDQIAIFAHDKRLPTYRENDIAGTVADGYDYGVCKFTDLFAKALYGKKFRALTKSQRGMIIKKTEHDISDHMPAWIRLRVPGL
jgi:endonuclease/exonuclease/phosphatase family metal-dependent hydrolase